MEHPQPVVRLATPEDADALVELVQRCYQGTYTNHDAVDPDSVAFQIASGCAAIGIAELNGTPVGTAALERINPLAGSYCRGVVDVACRGQGILGQLGQLLIHEVAPRLGIRYVHSSVVTNHPYAQRHCAELGATATGLLLGLYPANMRMQGIGGVEQPVSAAQIVFVHDPEPEPRRLGLRGRDLLRARAVLDAFEIPSARRREGSSSSGLRWRTEERPGIGLVHLVPDASGAAELPLEAGCLARLLWVDVPATHEGAQDLVDALREQGFCYGAYLPGLGPDAQDVVRMQRYQGQGALASAGVVMAPAFLATRDDVFADYRWAQGVLA